MRHFLIGPIGIGAIAMAITGCAPSRPSVHAPEGVLPLEKKLAKDPNDPKINLTFGESAEAGGDYLRAEQYYLRAEALGVPEKEVLPRILRVLVASQRYGEALERCHRRLQISPDDRTTRYVEAALYVALDRPKDAERELSSLMRSLPNDPEAYLALGRLYKETNPTRSRSMFEQYLKLAPKGEEAEGIKYDLEESGEHP